MTATDLLRRQHARIEWMMGALQAAGEEERWQLRSQLGTLLRTHFAMEERFFYPRFESLPGFAAVTRYFEEHRQSLHSLFQLERTGIDDPDFRDRLGMLQQIVLEHVLDEEEHLLPGIESLWTEEMLEGLGQEMEAWANEIVSPESEIHP